MNDIGLMYIMLSININAEIQVNSKFTVDSLEFRIHHIIKDT